MPTSQSTPYAPISIAFSGDGGVVEISERYAMILESNGAINYDTIGQMLINFNQLTPGKWGTYRILKFDKNLKFLLS